MASKIPTIDFSQFLNSDPETRLVISKSIVQAFRTYGFVSLTGHPIPLSEVSEAFKWTKLFFDLPSEVKSLAPHPPGFLHHRGYSHPGLEKVSNLTRGTDTDSSLSKTRGIPDIKESYEIGSEHYLEQPNIWIPQDVLPGFQEFMTKFYWSLAEFSAEIAKALALGIGLDDENYFEKFFTGHHNQLRLLHYPEVDASILEEGKGVRISAHRDWGAFTLLFQDDCGGLEVESPTNPGEFFKVEPDENACLVNIADLMARWSNDYLRSTSHRVGLPPLQDRYTSDGGKRTTRARYSIPYFVTTTPESLIECLLPFTDEAHPAKYPPITQWDYSKSKSSMQYS
ncbi:hypothetical protein TWF106_004318 [Orbilia oligospora]|uniref:Fe2OG dioxygenase domain-containing protein n=1 Tax=Orbilia oligospora TaxID=2813651 RepID=A0A7C8R4C5_ORBOL|nr:hypothetical protein TWF106_004318 [Orbilia oligospora]